LQLTDADAIAIETNILNAAVHIPSTAFTATQLAELGYGDVDDLSSLFGEGGASSKVMVPAEVEDLVCRSIDYLTTVYGARATFADIVYAADNDLDNDGVDDLDTYDDNTFALVYSSDIAHPDVAGLSAGAFIPRGAYSAIMYRCANAGEEVRTDNLPAGAPVAAEAETVEIAVPVLSGQLLTTGGKAQVHAVLKLVVDRRYHDAKRAHALAVGVPAKEDSFRVAADLKAVASGIARAKFRLEELQRLGMARLRTSIGNIQTARISVSNVDVNVATKKFHKPAKTSQPARVASPMPPEMEQLMMKHEATAMQITEHVKALEKFAGAKRRIEQTLSKGTIKNAMNELRRYRQVKPAVLAVCASVMMMLDYKGILQLLPPEYHIPEHPNQQLTMWMHLRPNLKPMDMVKMMMRFAPDKVGEGVTDPEELWRIEERFKACLVLVADWPFEKVVSTSSALGALHEWTGVACHVRREHNAVKSLNAEVERIDHVLASAGWQAK